MLLAEAEAVMERKREESILRLVEENSKMKWEEGYKLAEERVKSEELLTANEFVRHKRIQEKRLALTLSKIDEEYMTSISDDNSKKLSDDDSVAESKKKVKDWVKKNNGPNPPPPPGNHGFQPSPQPPPMKNDPNSLATLANDDTRTNARHRDNGLGMFLSRQTVG